MTIVQCPRCRDEVTVPARASTRALVRCPLCLEQYLLGEAIAEIPPSLIVLDGSAGSGPDDEPALVGAGVAAAEAGANGTGASGADEYRISSGFERALDSRPGSGPASPARPLVKGDRPKRKEKSAVVEIAKVVVGGLIGCVLAPLVLWHVFGNDSLQLGPLVAPYAPWAVPEQFHGKPAPTGGDTAALTAPKNGNAGGKIAKAKVGTASPTESDSSKASAGLTELPTEVPPTGPVDPGDLLTIDDPLAVSPNVAPTKTGKSAEPSIDPLPPNPLPPNPAPFNPAAAPVEPRPPMPAADPPLPTAADFEKAVLAAAEGLDKVNEPGHQSREARQQLYTDMYLAAAEVGRLATYLSMSDSDLIQPVEALKAFLGSLAAQPGKVNALKSLTSLHLPARKHGEGVLVAGVVEDFRAAGSMFECTVQAGRMQEGRPLIETAVICATNPQDFCQAGDELLIVGRVVEDPQKNLPGYEGDRTRVVLYGYSVNVPK